MSRTFRLFASGDLDRVHDICVNIACSNAAIPFSNRRCYIAGMAKTLSRKRAVKRGAGEIRWIKLKDGRRIAAPPPGGGKLKRSEIAKVVREVIMARVAASKQS